MMQQYTTNFVISQDITKIYYCQMGSGEGLLEVLLRHHFIFFDNYLQSSKRPLDGKQELFGV